MLKSYVRRARASALLTPGLIAGFAALGIVALIPIAVKRFRCKAV